MSGRFFVISSYNKVKTPGTPHDGVHHIFDYALDIDFKTPDVFVSVVRASIPKTWYLVNSGLNTLTMTEPGQPAVLITVPPGNYGAASFVTLLNGVAPTPGLLTAASTTGVTYTAAFSNSTGKLTITSVPATATSFTFANSSGEGIHDLWGQLAGSTVTMANGSLVSTTVCSYVTQDTVCIKSDMSNSPDKILQSLNGATVPFGASITWECPDIRMNANRLTTRKKKYTFWLSDADGHDLNTNGRPWSLTLCLFFNPDAIGLDLISHFGPIVEQFLKLSNEEAEIRKKEREDKAIKASEPK